MNVLLIDDHPLCRAALRVILEEICSSLNLHEAESVSEALNLLNNYNQFDLVLLDLNLPDANGLKSFIPVSQGATGTPVVVISANINKKMINYLLNVGAMGYIPKFSSNREIKNALKMVLNGSMYIPTLAIAYYCQP